MGAQTNQPRWLRSSLLPLLGLLAFLVVAAAGVQWLLFVAVVARYNIDNERGLGTLGSFLRHLPPAVHLAAPPFLIMLLVLARRRRRVRLTPLVCVTGIVATPMCLLLAASGHTSIDLGVLGIPLGALTIPVLLLIAGVCALVADARVPVVDERPPVTTAAAPPPPTGP